MTSGTDMARARARMVERQLEARGIRDTRVLAAMRAVRRELFVPPDRKRQAYDDTALDIGEGQTISQPYIVALMLELARVSEGDRVLEVGAGSGYGAAVLARLARDVTAIERHSALVAAARRDLAAAGADTVEVVHGDGTQGLARHAPFDVIIVSAGGALPVALETQLSIGGRLVMPVGGSRHQSLKRITRRSARDFDEEDFGPVAFVPLVPEPAPGDD